jgi:hypothetical protein
MEYSPELLVMDLKIVPWAVFVNVTWALGTTPPLSSVTSPFMELDCCAKDEIGG